MQRPGTLIPSDTSLSNSIQIKKTPLISSHNPRIKCRYKGGHFEITYYMCFEYIRGVSEAAGGGSSTRRRANSKAAERNLRENSVCYVIHLKIFNIFSYVMLGDMLGDMRGISEASLRLPHRKICGVSALSAKTARESLRNSMLSHINPLHTTLNCAMESLRGTGGRKKPPALSI